MGPLSVVVVSTAVVLAVVLAVVVGYLLGRRAPARSAPGPGALAPPSAPSTISTAPAPTSPRPGSATVGATPPDATGSTIGEGPESPIAAAVGREPAAETEPTTEVTGPEHGLDSRAGVDIERALADLRLGVVVVRADGSEVYRNNRAQRIARGRHGDALVEAALGRVIQEALGGTMREENVEVFGPPARSLMVQATPTFAEGRVDGAVAVVDDVTEFRNIHRVRSDFVANVSHELRTPVGAMSVLAETMAYADDPEVIDRLSKRMLREANRLVQTIDDLLALARLEAGPVRHPETIDLVRVAELAIERTGEAARQRSVEVTAELAAPGSVMVQGDQGQLVAAVSNLIDNAIKYSSPGGVVSVRVCAVIGSLKADGAEIGSSLFRRGARNQPAPDRKGHWSDDRPLAEISVLDHGIGIPERDHDRIFERFYRVDGARSRDTGGTGLGLSIVRHAVGNHRGTIDVDSVEGFGSTFTVRLPRLGGEHHQRSTSPSRPAATDHPV